MQKPTLRRLISTSFAVAAAITISATSQLRAHEDSAEEPSDPVAEKEQALTLKPGDKTPSFDTEGMEWIKGDVVKNLDEAGKLYMIECWATWCGPCIAAIPHVNELHEKFSDKGLVIIGMNVFEDGLDMVRKFAEGQGDKMAYRVAYSGGRSSEFGETWLKAAGVNGIPHAFFVKDGVLIATSHPAKVDHELINKFMSEDFDATAYAKEQAAIEAHQQEMDAKAEPFILNEDWAGLKKFATEELTAEADLETRKQLLTTAALKMGDWRFVTNSAAATDDSEEATTLFARAAFSSPAGEGVDEAVTKALEIFTQEKFENGTGFQDSLTNGLVRVRYLSLADREEEAAVLLGDLEKIEMPNPGMKKVVAKIVNKVATALEGNGPLGPLDAMVR